MSHINVNKFLPGTLSYSILPKNVESNLAKPKIIKTF